MPSPAFGFQSGNGAPGEADPRPVLLLIDDDPLVGRFIAHAGEACGYRAVRTTGVERFRQAYRTRTPDAVAVDLGLAGCDGIEIMRFLADVGCTVPVLVISGFDRRVLEASVRLGETLGLNMAGALEKPVLVHQLAERLGARQPADQAAG
jgi:DNA-binding response OmpR family regulator